MRNVEAYYVDDTYKVLPNLTISAGLRYELTPPWNDTFGNNFNVDVQVMPKMGDTSTTYPQSQWPFYVRQGNCTPANVYQGLVDQMDNYPRSAAGLQQRNLAQWSADGYPLPEFCAALRHLVLAELPNW